MEGIVTSYNAEDPSSLSLGVILEHFRNVRLNAPQTDI
jgi:hypothetical protein